MTLIEIVVSMSLMLVVTGLFVGCVVQAYGMSNRNESATQARSELHNAFSRLEKAVRYASAVTEPGASGTAQYVELATSNTGVVICQQLRLSFSTGMLQSRSWQQGGSSSTWSTLASNVIAPASFVRSVTATDGPERQQLAVTLSVRTGRDAAATVQRGAVTYTALNTSMTTDATENPCRPMGRP